MLIQDHCIRERESFAYAREIHKPYGVLDSVLSWARSECRGDWRWQLIDMSSDQRPGRYCFYFDNPADYSAFVLKWT